MQSDSNFSVYITKDELNALPVERFTGKIVVISSEKTAVKAIEELEKAPLVGFDTETKPNFKKGKSNNVALLQLSTAEKCFLIRLSKIGMPKRVKEFLENGNIKKVGLSIKDDFLNLSRLCEMKPDGFIDIQDRVKDFKIKDCSLTKIHGIVFGKRISKGQQLSNWEASSLTGQQKRYAALDAVACVNIYNELSSGRFVPEKSKYYRSEEETV